MERYTPAFKLLSSGFSLLVCSIFPLSVHKPYRNVRFDLRHQVHAEVPDLRGVVLSRRLLGSAGGVLERLVGHREVSG